MEPSRACPRCGDTVDVEVIREERERVCFASYIVGTCRSCGKTFTEAEVLTLKELGQPDRPDGAT